MGNPNWRTPRDLFERLNVQFGFTLDAAADHENALLPRYCTEATDGLSLHWGTWGEQWSCNCLCHQSNALVAANASRRPLSLFLRTLECEMASILGVDLVGESGRAPYKQPDEQIPLSVYDYFKKRNVTPSPLRDGKLSVSNQKSITTSADKDILAFPINGAEPHGSTVWSTGIIAAPTADEAGALVKITSSLLATAVAQVQSRGTSSLLARHATPAKMPVCLSPGLLLQKFWSASCPTCQDCRNIPAKIFLNPPYNNIEPWVVKAVQSAKYGTLTVMLLPPDVDRKWFHRYVWNRKEGTWRKGVHGTFHKGRLKFGDPEGRGRSQPTQGNMIVIFYPRPGDGG